MLVRPISSAEWREAAHTASICVWDLQVMAFERDAYVETVLSAPADPDVEAYLARHLDLE